MNTSQEKNGLKNISAKSRNKKKINFRRLLLVLFVVVVACGAGRAYYYGKNNAIKANPTAESHKETEKIVSSVGKLMELPKDETPTIATVADTEKLKEQPFFSKAKNGDMVFAYTTAMTAILYRPSINKIINVAPISINQSENVTQNTENGTSSLNAYP